MLDGPGMFACGTTLGPRPTKVDEDESGADPPVRAGPPGPALSSTSRRGRRLRTRGCQVSRHGGQGSLMTWLTPRIPPEPPVAYGNSAERRAARKGAR